MAAAIKGHNNKAVPAAYLILEKGGKVLMSIRSHTGWQDGKYQLPAGHVEEDELPEQAIVREAREEAGIIVSKKALRLIHVSYQLQHDATGNRVNFFFSARKWRGRIQNKEPHKCEGWAWVDATQIPAKKMMPPVKEALDACLKNSVYSGLDKAWITSHY